MAQNIPMCECGNDIQHCVANENIRKKGSEAPYHHYLPVSYQKSFGTVPKGSKGGNVWVSRLIERCRGDKPQTRGIGTFGGKHGLNNSDTSEDLVEKMYSRLEKKASRGFEILNDRDIFELEQVEIVELMVAICYFISTQHLRDLVSVEGLRNDISNNKVTWREIYPEGFEGVDGGNNPSRSGNVFCSPVV